MAIKDFVQPARLAMIIGCFALMAPAAGCSSAERHTEVVLPNGVTCQSTTQTHSWWADRSLSCTDQSGKVIGSYKSD